MEKDTKTSIAIDVNKAVNHILAEKQLPEPLPFVKGKLYVFDDRNQLKISDPLNINHNGIVVIGRKRTAIFAPTSIAKVNDKKSKFCIVKSGQVLMFLKYEMDVEAKTIRYEFLHAENTVWIDHIAAMQYFDV